MNLSSEEGFRQERIQVSEVREFPVCVSMRVQPETKNQ